MVNSPQKNPEEVNLGKGVEAENGMRIATPEEVSAGVTDRICA